MMQIQIDVQTLSSAQLECVTRLSCEYGDGVVRGTTGRALKLDGVRIESVPDVFQRLMDGGLISADGRKGTVGHAVSCPRAGSCPRERFNVVPYALAVSAYLRSFDHCDGLSPEHTIAFSGCPSDCALAAVADLGFFAQCRDDTRGFSVRVGGGLGPPPIVGVEVESFAHAANALAVAEAARCLFCHACDQTGGRDVPLRAIVEHLGADEFIGRYQEERARIDAEGVPVAVLKVVGPAPCGSDDQETR